MSDYQDNLVRELREVREPLTTTLRVSKSDAVPQLYAELFHLADINHEFLSKEFTASIRSVRAAYKVAYEAMNNPEEIMGKLAVLSISGVGEYVHEVGYRESEGIFYVTH